jgi:hypothetical protein
MQQIGFELMTSLTFIGPPGLEIVVYSKLDFLVTLSVACEPPT